MGNNTKDKMIVLSIVYTRRACSCMHSRITIVRACRQASYVELPTHLLAYRAAWCGRRYRNRHTWFPSQGSKRIRNVALRVLWTGGTTARVFLFPWCADDEESVGVVLGVFRVQAVRHPAVTDYNGTG